MSTILNPQGQVARKPDTGVCPGTVNGRPCRAGQDKRRVMGFGSSTLICSVCGHEFEDEQ